MVVRIVWGRVSDCANDEMRGPENFAEVVEAIPELDPELTLTAVGAFACLFGPTVRAGVLDTDLLVPRTTSPLTVPAGALARISGSLDTGHDARIGIRRA